jgi:hypothetical protein
MKCNNIYFENKASYQFFCVDFLSITRQTLSKNKLSPFNIIQSKIMQYQKSKFGKIREILASHENNAILVNKKQYSENNATYRPSHPSNSQCRLQGRALFCPTLLRPYVPFTKSGHSTIHR